MAKLGYIKGNIYTYLGDGTMEVDLGKGRFGIIDESDFYSISKYTWRAIKGRKTYYMATDISVNSKRVRIYSHSIILNGKQIDHIDGNGLNNSMKNLRSCSYTQNSFNTGLRIDNSSGFKGVSFYKSRNKWVSQIKIDGKHITIGYFSSPIDAARAYDNAAIKHFGSFARTNHQMDKV